MKRKRGEALDDVVFDADYKFVYIMVHNRPFGIISTGQVSVEADCILLLYSGQIELANFAESVLSAGGREEVAMVALLGAAGPCFSTIGWRSEDLRGLPGSVVPYEVGYSCSGCKACLIVQFQQASFYPKRAFRNSLN